PSEIRGEFKPIATKVPGLDICEVFPRLAGLMDQAVVIRSVVGATDRHEAFQCNTGWLPNELTAIGGRPSLRALVSKLQGPADPAVPAFVGRAQPTQPVPWSDPGTTGFLSPAYGPFKPDGPGLANMKLKDITLEQLSDRRRLLQSFDHLRRDIDAWGAIDGVD